MLWLETLGVRDGNRTSIRHSRNTPRYSRRHLVVAQPQRLDRSISQSSKDRREESRRQSLSPIAAMVRSGTIWRRQRLEHNNRLTRSAKPRVRAEVRLHLYHLRDRQNLRRDCRGPTRTTATRSCG